MDSVGRIHRRGNRSGHACTTSIQKTKRIQAVVIVVNDEKENNV